MLGMSTTRNSLLCAALCAVLLAGAAHAGPLTYVRSFSPLPGVSIPQALATTLDGGVLVQGPYHLIRFSPGWSPQLDLANETPGLTNEPYQWLSGSLQLSDGRLVGMDYSLNRIVVWNAAGTILTHWAWVSGTQGNSLPRLAPNGDFFMATTSYGFTTISDWSPNGTIVKWWTAPTTGHVLALAGGVLYLAGGPTGRIFKFGLDGTDLGQVPVNTGPNVLGMGVDNSGRIYLSVNNPGLAFLWALSPEGVTLSTINQLATGTNLAYPSDILITGSRLLVADPSFTGIHEFTIDSPVPTASTSWGYLKSIYR